MAFELLQKGVVLKLVGYRIIYTQPRLKFLNVVHCEPTTIILGLFSSLQVICLFLCTFGRCTQGKIVRSF